MKVGDRVTKDKVMKVENPVGVIEKITNKRFEEFLVDEFFRKIGCYYTGHL